MRPKTIFIDIDGVLLKQFNQGLPTQLTTNITPIQGSLGRLLQWDAFGYNIILTTGRRESQRVATENQLARFGIFYDQLIMGIGGGDRILINDCKPDSEEDTCFAINLTRNEGLKNVKI